MLRLRGLITAEFVRFVYLEWTITAPGWGNVLGRIT